MLTLTNDEDIIKLIHAIYLREKLIDHCIVHSSGGSHGPSRLTDSIDFVKDYYVETTVRTHLKQAMQSINEYKFKYISSSYDDDIRDVPKRTTSLPIKIESVTVESEIDQSMAPVQIPSKSIESPSMLY